VVGVVIFVNNVKIAMPIALCMTFRFTVGEQIVECMDVCAPKVTTSRWTDLLVAASLVDWYARGLSKIVSRTDSTRYGVYKSLRIQSYQTSDG
jgi:hypothetical protein